MEFIQSSLFIIVGGVLYFLPTLLATQKRNFWAIFALNLLAGWIFGIGWIIALVWALSKDNPQINQTISKEDEAYFRWKYEQEKKNNLE